MAVVPFAPTERHDPYATAREDLIEMLIRYTLLDSYANFTRRGQRYPFTDRVQILPNRGLPGHEHRDQNTAFLIMLDGTLPRSLVKHFRIRQSNQVSWRNIQRLAPQLDISDYKAEHCRFGSSQFLDLVRRLSTVDYALLVEHPAAKAESTCVLTHMHVKVERLTDNAVKDLGKALGYIDRRLFERGEDYVDAIEAKFFEYHGFSANASGRKSAAAMAAQLLAGQEQRFSVFVAGQDDCRLTILDESKRVTQYLLIRLEGEDERHLRAAAMRAKVTDLAPFRVPNSAADGTVVLYRVRLRRTAAARPAPEGVLDRSLTLPWLDIVDEAVLPLPGEARIPLSFPWSASD